MSKSTLTPPTVVIHGGDTSQSMLTDGDTSDTQNGHVTSVSSNNVSHDDGSHVVDVDDNKSLTPKTDRDSSPNQTRQFERRSSLENFGLISLLTPALTALPSVQGKDEWSNKFKELKDEHRDLVLAAAHIDDALHGRGAYGKARAIFKSSFPQKCFHIIDNKWWRRLVALFIVLFSVLPLWESPNVAIKPGQIEVWVIVLEVVCILILIVDLVLSLLFYTCRRFWTLPETKWLRVEFVFTCLFTIDLILLCIQELLPKVGSSPVRIIIPFRCLRAATFMCKTKNVAHIFDVCVSIVFKLGKVFFVISLFIMVFAGTGVHLFGPDYHFIGCANRTGPNCTENFNDVYTGAFDHFFNASLQLFVLLTTENFPEFMMPAFDVASYSFIYFGLFLYVGVFFLTAILLAIIVDNYWAFSKKNVKMERKRERAEIIKAWNILDPLGDGSLSVGDEKLVLLFKRLRPQNSEDEIKELIDYVDDDGDGVIDTFEWTTRLTDALNYEFEKEPVLYTKSCCPTCALGLSESIRHFVQSVALTRSILVLIIIHTILFFIKWYKMSDEAAFIVQGMKTAIIVIFLIETILRIIGMGHHLRDQPLEVADIIITFIAIVTNLSWYPVKYLSNQELALGGITVVSSFAVLARMGFNSKQTKSMVLTFLQIFPVMFDLTILITIIVYFYAVLGMESFSSFTPSPVYTSGHYDYKCELGFHTFSCSLLVVFQILSTSNWHEILNATMISVSPWTWLYFTTCYLILNMVFLNLFVAIAIEAFNKLAATGDELNNTLTDTLQGEKDKRTFVESAKKFFSNVLASSRDKRHQHRRPSLAVINEERRRSMSVVPAITASQLAFLQTEQIDDKHERLSIRSRLSRNNTPDELNVASHSNLNTDRVDEDHLTVPTVTHPQSSSESELEDMSGLTFQQKREKLIKKRRQKRKRTLSKIKVMMAFRKSNEDQIDLHVGDEVKVLETKGEWMRGVSRGRTGWFPAKYVMETVKKNRARGGTVSPEPPVVQEPEFDANQNLSPSPLINRPEDIKPAMAANTKIDDVASSLMKSRMKKQGGDWRRRIHGDMTVMNHEEMLELNRLVKADLRSNRSQSRASVQSRISTSSLRENTLTETPEVASEAPGNLPDNIVVPQDTRSNKKGQINIDPPPTLPEVIEEENEEEEGKLQVEKPKPPKNPKKEKLPGGEMPEWAKKFVQAHSIEVTEDIKIDENLKPLEDSQSNSSRNLLPRRSSLSKTASRPKQVSFVESPVRPGSTATGRADSAKSKKSEHSVNTARSTSSAKSASHSDGAEQPDKQESASDKAKMDPEWGIDNNESTDKAIDDIRHTMDEAEKIESRSSSGRSRSSSLGQVQKDQAPETSVEGAASSKSRRSNRAAMMAKLRR